jgi:hypothetical protein
MMAQIDYCRLAPTWLSKGDEKKLFKTQAEVDAAWDSGWHGPDGVKEKGEEKGDNVLPISKQLFGTKAELAAGVAADQRYKGLKLDIQNMTRAVMTIAILEFETANGIGD